jgi:hypothetical protein
MLALPELPVHDPMNVAFADKSVLSSLSKIPDKTLRNNWTNHERHIAINNGTYQVSGAYI